MLQVNGLQLDAIARLGDSETISVVELRREDSLGNEMSQGGHLVARVTPHSGDAFTVAIGETGSTVGWE
jgi:hypothetical protein